MNPRVAALFLLSVFLCTHVVAAEINPSDWDSNLIAVWHLNDKNASGWVLNSVTGARDGNLVGGADVNGAGLWSTNAGWFDNYGYIDVPAKSVYDFNDEMSLSVWVNLNLAPNVGGVSEAVTKTNQWYYPDWSMFLYYYGSGLYYPRFHFGKAYGEDLYSLSTLLHSNRWYHLVAVVKRNSNDKTALLYVNGNLVASKSTNAGLFGSTGGVRIGGTSTRDFNGLVEEVAIWNRALTASEVASLYTAGASTGCVVPTNDLNIQEDTTLCRGNYDINDSGAPGVVRIEMSGSGGDYVVLDCNGASFSGTGSYGIYVNGAPTYNLFSSNIEVKNCDFSNRSGSYDYSLFVEYGKDLNVHDNNFLGSTGDVYVSYFDVDGYRNPGVSFSNNVFGPSSGTSGAVFGRGYFVDSNFIGNTFRDRNSLMPSNPNGCNGCNISSNTFNNLFKTTTAYSGFFGVSDSLNFISNSMSTIGSWKVAGGSGKWTYIKSKVS